MRSENYKKSKLNNDIIQVGRKLFESKWGFSCMWFPSNKIKVDPLVPMEVSIISRAIYNDIGPLHDVGIIDQKYLDMMQRNFINSLKAQTDQEFKLYLAVGPENCNATKAIKNLDWSGLNITFLYTSGDLTQWKDSIKKSKNWARETDKGSPEDIIKSLDYPRTSIMARIDIDDWVTPGWVAHMKFMANTMSERRFLINYQVFGQAPDGRVYSFYAPHTKNRTSPFIAIVQKDEITTDVYETVHLRMGDHFDVVYTIPPSYAFMVVHGGNRCNQVYELDSFSYTRESVNNLEKNNEKTVIIDHFKPKVDARGWRQKVQDTEHFAQSMNG
jgi:hypothetical protein